MSLKRVVFIVTNLNAGGIETDVLRFLRYYDGQLLPIVICKGNEYGDLYEEYQKIQNIKIIPMNLGYFNAFGFWFFKVFLDRENPDSIVDFTGNFAGLPLFCGRMSGVRKRIAFYKQSSNIFKENFIKLWYNRWMRDLVYRNATSILFNSRTAMNFFFKNKRIDDRFEVINNGIDIDIFLNTKDDLRQELGIPKDAFVIGNVGRYTEVKNQKAVLKVADNLCQRARDIYFVVCGKGVVDGLLPMIDRKPYRNHIKLLDVRKDIAKVLNTLDAFYLPSYTEGQPNVLIENMLMGTPFIASDIMPIREMLPKEMLSNLVAPDDVITASELLYRIYENKDNTNGEMMIQWAKKKFDAKHQFMQFYNKL